MIEIRDADDRGLSKFDWLTSRHTFSFADYHDPVFMGYGPLRVINEDRVEAGRGFGRHSHQDMEILSWVLEGALRHEDSTGTGAVIRPGEMQRMSAGTGITHSEFNDSPEATVHFLQIWIIPSTTGLAPGYEQKSFAAELVDRLRLVASGDAREGSVRVHQDADVYAARLAPGAELTHAFAGRRIGWVQVARGSVDLDGQPLHQGDGAALAGLSTVAIRANEAAEILLFDMAP